MKLTPALPAGSANVSVTAQLEFPRMTCTATCGASESAFDGIVAAPETWNWVEVSDKTVRVKEVNGAPSGETRPPPESVVQSWTRAHW